MKKEYDVILGRTFESDLFLLSGWNGDVVARQHNHETDVTLHNVRNIIFMPGFNADLEIDSSKAETTFGALLRVNNTPLELDTSSAATYKSINAKIVERLEAGVSPAVLAATIYPSLKTNLSLEVVTSQVSTSYGRLRLLSEADTATLAQLDALLIDDVDYFISNAQSV